MDASLCRPLPSGKGWITQPFGANPASYARWDMAGHNGIDYGVACGTPVLAAHEGIVEHGSDPEGYGTYIRVVNGYRITIYGHLSATTAAQGQRVQAAEQIGLSGNTGNSTGPHLHFGLKWVRGCNPAYRDWVDPVPFR